MSKKNLYLGAAYYPEVYYFETIDEDIEYMKKARLNVMRMGEFAWSVFEPQEGQYNFKWLKKVVDKLYQNGIYSILCTPSNTPPIWLTKKHPEILRRDDNGSYAVHGGRGHGCPNSPVFNSYVQKIVSKMAQYFKDHEAVIGWQIDNEIYPWLQGCHCDFCMKEFYKHLKKKYKTIDNLNKQMALRIWSIEYSAFDQIEYPKIKDWGSHPAFTTEYIDFQMRSNANFISRQADILRENGIKVPIGTDMMTFVSQDHYITNQNLDVVMINHYHSKENFYECAFWMDYMSRLKDRPFWNTETATTANGANSVNPSLYPIGYNYINTLIPFAFRGEMNLYWLFRAHYAGPELMHSSVITSQGKPVHVFDETVQAAQTLEKCQQFLTEFELDKAEFAMSFSSNAYNIFEGQKVVAGFHYTENIIKNCYYPLLKDGIAPSVHNPNNSLDGIKVLYSPFLISIEEGDFAARLIEWVNQGGIWIAGPLTDIRNRYYAKYRNSVFGFIEDLTGIQNIYQIPSTCLNNTIEFEDGILSKTTIWNDVFLTKPEHKVIARYNSPSPSIDQKAAIVGCKVGKGEIVVMGAMPEQERLLALIKTYLKKADCAPKLKTSSNVLAIKRRNGDKIGYCVIELFYEKGWVELDGQYLDVETSTKLSGVIEIEPYSFRCLEKID
ncbi:MAG TPA: hypothetical protein GX745_01430 [Clostridiales bacterium]|nr:hypothetical protein [Clostridiales bacterium]